MRQIQMQLVISTKLSNRKSDTRRSSGWICRGLAAIVQSAARTRPPPRSITDARMTRALAPVWSSVLCEPVLQSNTRLECPTFCVVTSHITRLVGVVFTFGLLDFESDSIDGFGFEIPNQNHHIYTAENQTEWIFYMIAAPAFVS